MGGLYLHIPFCKSYCNYCDFYSETKLASKSALVAAIIKEAAFRRDFFKELKEKVSTLYFGGGTPSLLSAGEIGMIVKELSDVFETDLTNPSIEFTIEANPDDLIPEYLTQLRRVGVNRLSIGFQSFFDEHLKWMNRRHDSKQALQAFKNAREAGFDNISADLIFGFSLLSIEQWREEVRQIVELKPEHVSAYQLSIEPNSKLGREYERGKYTPVSDEDSLREYEYLRRELTNSGYNHYEISNFALPTKESKHNSSYWNRTPYLGLGPGAHSYNRERRFWNIPDLKNYSAFFNNENNSKADTPFEEEVLTKADILNERVMLSLRMVEGMDLEALKNEFAGKLSGELISNIKSALSKGFLVEQRGKIKIPPEKLFVSDGIIRDLFVETD